jgi:peptide/nickel transport system ATP-binding protein
MGESATKPDAIDAPLLEIRDLEVHYATRAGVARAVNRVSLHLREGERFGLVGESGSGKSTLVWAALRMLKPPGRVVGGIVASAGRNLLDLPPEEFRRMRLTRFALIPQGAMNALNPVLRVGAQLSLAMAAHPEAAGSPRPPAIPELLDRVGLAAHVARRFPHELSGGMKQRVCIAMAISMKPRVIFADEPTSALDVIAQRQIMQTLFRLQQSSGTSVLLVGHDMGLMAQFTQRIGILYAGVLVETGPTRDVFSRPLHPYTRLLISSVPSFEARAQAAAVAGCAPSLLDPPGGCPFHPRCPRAAPECAHRMPEETRVAPDRSVRCPAAENS